MRKPLGLFPRGDNGFKNRRPRSADAGSGWECRGHQEAALPGISVRRRSGVTAREIAAARPGELFGRQRPTTGWPLRHNDREWRGWRAKRMPWDSSPDKGVVVARHGIRRRFPDHRSRRQLFPADAAALGEKPHRPSRLRIVPRLGLFPPASVAIPSSCEAKLDAGTLPPERNLVIQVGLSQRQA